MSEAGAGANNRPYFFIAIPAYVGLTKNQVLAHFTALSEGTLNAAIPHQAEIIDQLPHLKWIGFQQHSNGKYKLYIKDRNLIPNGLWYWLHSTKETKS